LRGQNEVFANQLSSVQRQQESNYANLDGRLKKFEPTEQTIDGVQGVVQPGESNAFDAALQQFRNGSYKQAATAFRGFMQRYPKSPYLPSAQYWLGNSLYALHDYANSKRELDKLIKNYPNHPRVPEALLALAYDQIAQNQKGAARKTLQQILAQYPSASVAQDATKALGDLK
jgi:tol-pal system protein YbgF